MTIQDKLDKVVADRDVLLELVKGLLEVITYPKLYDTYKKDLVKIHINQVISKIEEVKNHANV